MQWDGPWLHEVCGGPHEVGEGSDGGPSGDPNRSGDQRGGSGPSMEQLLRVKTEPTKMKVRNDTL